MKKPNPHILSKTRALSLERFISGMDDMGRPYFDCCSPKGNSDKENAAFCFEMKNGISISVI